MDFILKLYWDSQLSAITLGFLLCPILSFPKSFIIYFTDLKHECVHFFPNSFSRDFSVFICFEQRIEKCKSLSLCLTLAVVLLPLFPNRPFCSCPFSNLLVNHLSLNEKKCFHFPSRNYNVFTLGIVRSQRLFTIYKIFREIRLKSKLNATFWVFQTENFREQRNIRKGSPVFPDGIFQREICVPFLQSPLWCQFQAFAVVFR